MTLCLTDTVKADERAVCASEPRSHHDVCLRAGRLPRGAHRRCSHGGPVRRPLSPLEVALRLCPQRHGCRRQDQCRREGGGNACEQSSSRPCQGLRGLIIEQPQRQRGGYDDPFIPNSWRKARSVSAAATITSDGDPDANGVLVAQLTS